MVVDVWTEDYFSTNNITIHYYRSVPAGGLGSPGVAAALPILIWLHGLVQSGGTLIEPALNFTADFDVILPDARGHGQSSPLPKGTFTMPWLVADATAVIKRFGGGEPVFLMGHSMGAATAARVAKGRPDLIRALVLEEPPWNRVQGGMPDVASSSEVAQTLPGPTRDLRNMSNEEFVLFDTGAENLPPHAMSSSQAQRAWDVDDCEGTLMDVDLAITEAVKNITVPVELQIGDPDAVVPPFMASALDPAVAEATVATFPRGTLRFFQGGSHLLHIDPTVGVWTTEVRRFFKSFLQQSDNLDIGLRPRMRREHGGDQ